MYFVVNFLGQNYHLRFPLRIRS